MANLLGRPWLWVLFGQASDFLPSLGIILPAFEISVTYIRLLYLCFSEFGSFLEDNFAI